MTNSEAASPMAASGTPMSHTALRHRVLAEVAAGRMMRVWADLNMTRTVYRCRPGASLTAAESRVLGDVARAGLLEFYVRLGSSVSAPMRVDLNPEGRALFREWNKRWGDLTIPEVSGGVS